MGLMKKLTSAVVASSLVLGLVGTAAADYSPAGVTAAAARMQALNVVKGVLQPDGSTDMMLGKNITRAELVTIIVRAFGQAETAKIVKGFPAFTDSGDHWASGEIAVAKNIIESKGHTLGVTATTFVPNKDVNAAEAIAFLMKFLGIKEDTTQSWPNNFINGAVKAGLITEADKTALTVSPLTPATRGLVFYFADQAFAGYKLENGKSVYTTYVDTTAPVVTVDSYEATTTATKVTLSGTAQGQSVLHVGSTSNVVAVGADGKWSTTVELALGENDVWVHALDAAGNAGVPAAAVKITRTAGAAATIEATVPATVVAGGSFELVAKAFDANKAEIADAEFAVTVEGNIGTFDAATGKFTAATAVGTGKLTIKSGEATQTVDVSVVAGALAKLTADKTSVNVGEKATLKATDAHGNTVTGVTYTIDNADANVGPSNGVFIASKAGTYTVTATANGVSQTLNLGVYGAATKLAVSAPTQIVANGTTYYAVTVRAADANGNFVTSAGTTNSVTLSVPGAIVADKDKATSENDSDLAAALVNGAYTFHIKGELASAGADLTLTASATGLTAGTASVSAQRQVAQKIVVNAPEYLTANTSNAGSPLAVTVSVVDQEGVAISGGVYEVKATVTGPATMDSTNGVYVTNNGVATIRLTNQQGVTGTINVTATVEGFAAASDSVKAVLAGDAKTIGYTVSKNSDTTGAAITSAKATDILKVTGQVKDANGVAVPYSGTLTITLPSDVNVKAFASAANATAGTPAITEIATNTDGTFTFFVATTGDYTGTFELSLDNKTGSAALDASKQNVAFTAGAYTEVRLTRNSTVLVPAANAVATATAQLYDAKGNAVKVAGVELTFASTTGLVINGVDNSEVVKTDANGSATVNITMQPFQSGALADYTLAVTGLEADGIADLLPATAGANDVAFSVEYSVAKEVAVTLYDAVNTTAVKGTLYLGATDATTQVLVKAVVKDTYGAGLAGLASNLQLTGSGAIFWDGTKLVEAKDVTLTWTPGTTAGEYTATVQIAKAGLQTVGVKIANGTADVTGSRNIAVNAAAASLATVNEAVSGKITVAAGTVAGPFTVQLTDKYGNAVSSTTKVTLKLGGTASVRKAAGDITAASVDIYSTSTVYVTTPTTGAFTITFAVDHDNNSGTADVSFGSVDVEAK